MQDTQIIDPEPLRKTARRFQLGFRAAFVLTLGCAVALCLAICVAPDWIGRTLSRATGFPLSTPTLWQSAAFVALTLAMLGIYAGVFRSASSVCLNLVQGDPARAGQAARRLSHWLWGLLVASILAHTLSVLIATALAGPGQRALSIALGSPQITLAIAALIAAFLARALVLGAALWQDHREII